MLKVAPGRRARGFTMLELIVSVGLMVVLLSVLAFVFAGDRSGQHGAEGPELRGATG